MLTFVIFDALIARLPPLMMPLQHHEATICRRHCYLLMLYCLLPLLPLIFAASRPLRRCHTTPLTDYAARHADFPPDAAITFVFATTLMPPDDVLSPPCCCRSAGMLCDKCARARVTDTAQRERRHATLANIGTRHDTRYVAAVARVFAYADAYATAADADMPVL